MEFSNRLRKRKLRYIAETDSDEELEPEFFLEISTLTKMWEQTLEESGIYVLRPLGHSVMELIVLYTFDRSERTEDNPKMRIHSGWLIVGASPPLCEIVMLMILRDSMLLPSIPQDLVRIINSYFPFDDQATQEWIAALSKMKPWQWDFPHCDLDIYPGSGEMPLWLHQRRSSILSTHRYDEPSFDKLFQGPLEEKHVEWNDYLLDNEDDLWHRKSRQSINLRPPSHYTSSEEALTYVAEHPAEGMILHSRHSFVRLGSKLVSLIDPLLKEKTDKYDQELRKIAKCLSVVKSGFVIDFDE